MFRWEECLEGHILIGLIFSTFAFVCMIIVTFSTPFIKTIYFLFITNTNGDATHYGAFGYCEEESDSCSSSKVGYEPPGPQNVDMPEWLLKTSILFGIAALLFFIAWITLILSLLRFKKFAWNPVYFRTSCVLAVLSAILAEIFALVLWVRAKHDFQGDGWVGWEAGYGAGLWIGLVGCIFGGLAAMIGGPAYQGRFMYRAHPGAAYNV
ncbi:hypothetical protein L198_08039 [Cryptococcus wingfieldii CBS 7118]|uniref:MARVEL domain-containing protein n=1 Tax=Cryptococcus wingfieldii CBS 7118 TaxID=1295528 RepID=A0A1E3HLV0_9TREE|nr:hypothetical protein L198_08039 [Cryptococcus wingfieldii CBS 7118]ODN77304.1 hypothetical protein L198_08039 [Cryptococcus wingfieldii CBS 7118]